MEKHDTPGASRFEQLLEELAKGSKEAVYFRGSDPLPPGPPPRVHVYPRIVDEARRWISFLHNQSQALTDTASRIYERLNAAGRLGRQTERAPMSIPVIVDRIEWTLAAVGYWIAERRPRDSGARFHIRWTATDGEAFWTAADTPADPPVSLLAIVQDGAESEGEFPPGVSADVAAIVVAALRSGEIQLQRLRPVPDESRPEESVFEPRPPGEAYLEAIAMAGDSAPVLSPELEAQLAGGPASRLSDLIDEVSYSAATALGDEFADEAFDDDIADGIARMAERYGIPPDELMRGMMVVVRERFKAAVRQGHRDGEATLANALTALSALMIKKRRM